VKTNSGLTSPSCLAHVGTAFIIRHLDVYQGTNSPNIGIDDSIADAPTTQKVVLNAVIARNIANSSHGARRLYWKIDTNVHNHVKFSEREKIIITFSKLIVCLARESTTLFLT
jgi:hypothetical protein